MAAMTDYQSLPPSALAKTEDASVNTAAITQLDLDVASASDLAEQARSRAPRPHLVGLSIEGCPRMYG